MKTKLTPRRPGSALAISLIMALLLLSIGAASMTLTTTNFRTTNASFSYHAMQPVGEAGLDQAVKALTAYIRLNRNSEGFIINSDKSTSWEPDGWSTTDSASYGGSVGGFSLQPNTLVAYKNFINLKPGDLNIELGDFRKVSLRVSVFNIPTQTTTTSLTYPTFAVAEVKFGTNTVATPSYTRQFLAVYSPVSSKGPGMIAINQLTFSGGNMFVSAYDASKGAPFDMSKGSNPTATDNASSDVTIATFDNNDVPLGQVNVYGFVSTTPSHMATWAQNAHIWDVDSPAYRKYPAKVGVDGFDNTTQAPVTGETPNVNTNFTSSLEDYKNPKTKTDLLSGITTNVTAGAMPLTTPGALPAKASTGPTKNVISINKRGVISPDVLDASTVPGGIYYLDSSLKITDAGSLTIKGPVTLIAGVVDPAAATLTWSRDTPLDIAGQGGILMPDNTQIVTKTKLQIYTGSDVSIVGNGIMGGDPSKLVQMSPDSLLIAGTYGSYSGDTAVNAGVQQIKLAGNGALNGTVNAPLATLTLSGGGTSGSMRGSVIAYNIDTNGTVSFYYDINQNKGLAARFRLGALVELKDATTKVTLNAIP